MNINKYKLDATYKPGVVPDIIKHTDHQPIINNNKNPELSVLTISKNLAPFLEDTIRSVINQTYTNYEHIIIDGGSTDNTIEIIKKYPHIRWISEKDSGYPEAFRKGLKMAKGKYVIQCAVSDAFAHKKWFEYAINKLNSDPEISLVWGLPQELSEDNITGQISYPKFHNNLAPSKEKFFIYWLMTFMIIPEGNLCARKEVLDKCYPKENDFNHVVDWCEFTYKFNKSGYLSHYLPVVANFGRTHGGQLQSNINYKLKQKSQKYLKQCLSFRKKILQTIKFKFKNHKREPLKIKFHYLIFLYKLSILKTQQAKNNIKVYAKKIYLLKNIFNLIKQLVLYKKFILNYNEFKKLTKNQEFKISWKDRLPCLNDKTSQTKFDAHYIYHPAWAARILNKIKPEKHIDISSTLHFCSLVSAFIPIEFYDFRPAKLNLNNLISKKADITSLPFENNSIKSLSCMHTIEHIGLGRYGDELDPDGDLKAIKELKRVLAMDGNLLFVVPIGKPKIMFNAHRIYAYDQIMEYFNDFELKDFSLITDKGDFIQNSNKKTAGEQKYGCGCFWFKK